MTRKEAVFQFFRKSIVPVAGAVLLVCIFKSACIKDGTVDYLWLWILCGLPFGLIGCGSGLYRAEAPWVAGLPCLR